MKKIILSIFMFFGFIVARAVPVTINSNLTIYMNDPVWVDNSTFQEIQFPIPYTVNNQFGATIISGQATSLPFTIDLAPGNYDFIFAYGKMYQGRYQACMILDRDGIKINGQYTSNRNYMPISNCADCNNITVDFNVNQNTCPWNQPQAGDVYASFSGAPVIGRAYNLANWPLIGTDPKAGYSNNINWTSHTCNQVITVYGKPTNGFILRYNGVEINSSNSTFTYTDASLLTITPGPTTPVGTKVTDFYYSITACDGNSSMNSGDYRVSFADAYLPVDFNSFNAQILNNTLSVNFTTATETNADHFDIEISKDGKTFKKAGTVLSKAKDGNSSVALDYTFTTNINTALGLFGITFFGLALAGSFLPRRGYSKLFAILSIAAITVAACNKATTDVTFDKNQKIMVRVVEYDKDSKVQYSRVITAVTE